MRDSDVRAVRLAALMTEVEGEADTLVVEELGVAEGLARVDVAVVNGRLSGIELKSARDTLDRLEQQAGVFSTVFDDIELVVAERHLDHSLDLVPDWWTITVASKPERTVMLETYRAGRANPQVSPFAVAQLLWREEALAILEDLGCSKGVKSKPRRFVWERLAECLSTDDLRSAVRTSLRSRTAWRAPS